MFFLDKSMSTHFHHCHHQPPLPSSPLDYEVFENKNMSLAVSLEAHTALPETKLIF